MATASDNFNRTETPLSNGGAWDNAPGTFTAVLETNGTTCQAAGSSQTDAMAMRNDIAAGSAQFSEMTLAAINASGWAGPCTRIQSTADGSCYNLQADGPAGAYILYRIDDTGSLAFVSVANVGGTPTAGDVVRLESNGSTHTCKVNGVTLGTPSDATYSGGQPGLLVAYGAATADTVADDWSGGDLAGGGGRTTKNTRSAPLGMEIGMNWRS